MSEAPGSGDRAVLAGAGSTFAATMVEEWARLYRRTAPGVEIAYEAVGSVGGAQRVASGAADFAVTEVPVATGEDPAAVRLPVLGGAVAVVYNLPGVDDLRLSEDTLARMFSGAVTRWDHPAVRRDNPDRPLPPTTVVPVHRSDPSGTTLAFTRYLGTAGPGVWRPGSGTSVEWPTGRGAAGSSGLLSSVGAVAGAVGYAAAGPARDAGVEVASLRNPAGSFVAPTAVAVDAALVGATGFEDNLTLTVPDRQETPAAYPVTVVSHLVFTGGLPQERDAALRNFGAWILTEGQRSATRLGFAPLPLPLLVRTLEGLLAGGGVRPRR
ncbi:MAG TPA: phosphate ABC transporter substrate-binding protein PstS [Acidimicrobiales bacterium]|nr:phosphate ABC transporter substrate-binding protein PstS [Acidimicrobiales bacterium]